MKYLFDPEQKRMYEVCQDSDVPNYGRLGGTVHVLIVRSAEEEPEWHDTMSMCSTGTCDVCDRMPIATDGRRMGAIERARCVEVGT